MSVTKVVYATPSRVVGVCKYLLNTKSNREDRERLCQILSPENLLERTRKKSKKSESYSEEEETKEVSREMVKDVIRQCINMKLLLEDGSDIAINPKINLTHEKQLPSVICNLFFSLENPGNHDFALALAWYLAQDFYNAPGNWTDSEQKLKEQVGADLLEFNRERYAQFEYWSCYLGFSWRNNLLVATKNTKILIPDPTAYLRQNLNNLFDNQSDRQIPIGEFINRLGKYCPVFETGKFREEIEQQIGLREPNYLSSVTSIALRRLEDEGLLKLERLSDTSILVLMDGSEDSRISHITWLGSNTNGEQP
jgi:hypothetical protein